jgi:hypothetical protein
MKQTADSNGRNIDGSRSQAMDQSDEQCVCFCFAFLCKHVQLKAILIRCEILLEWMIETQIRGMNEFHATILSFCASEASEKIVRNARYFEQTPGKDRQNNRRLSAFSSPLPISEENYSPAMPFLLKFAKRRSVRRSTCSRSQAEDSAISFFKYSSIQQFKYSSIQVFKYSSIQQFH